VYLLSVIMLSGCDLFNFEEAFKDTCSPGFNMTNPRVLGDFDVASLSPTLVITWDTGTERGAELPDRYFAEVRTSLSEDWLVGGPTFSPSPKNITLTFKSLGDFLAKEDTLEFDLLFPDRRGYIDCRHPASPDRYGLNVILKFSGPEFVGAEFRQFANLGPF
jgi:hypothetical protein